MAGASCCPTPMRGRKSGVRVTSSLPLVETAAMNASDLAEYCRKRGLFAEQIRAWRTACEQQANDWDRASSARLSQATKDENKRIKALERDPQRKEKALAAAAALLVLTTKAEAIPRGRSGRMISAPDRHRAVALIDEATAAGARRFTACAGDRPGRC